MQTTPRKHHRREHNEANDTRWLMILTIGTDNQPLGKVTVSWPAVFVFPSSCRRSWKKDTGCRCCCCTNSLDTRTTYNLRIICSLFLSRGGRRERETARPSLDHREANISQSSCPARRQRLVHSGIKIPADNVNGVDLA